MKIMSDTFDHETTAYESADWDCFDGPGDTFPQRNSGCNKTSSRFYYKKFVSIPFLEIIHATDMAYLIKFESGAERWIPKSMTNICKEPLGNKNILKIPTWLAKKVKWIKNNSIETIEEESIKEVTKMNERPIETKPESQELKLFVWTDFCTDYTSGLAFAIATNEADARKLVEKDQGCIRKECNWGKLTIYPLTEQISFSVCGGG